MPRKVEIEAKMSLVDPQLLRDKLAQLDANDLGEALEVNTFFDTPEGALRSADQGLRVRVCPRPSGKPKATITHKGPRAHGRLKSRPEIEIEVSDARSAARLLTALGFRKTLTFEKRRHTYELGDCEVVIDELPYLGCFVEIEGPTDEAVLALRRQLHLEDLPLIRASYIALMQAYLAEHQIASREVLFEHVGR